MIGVELVTDRRIKTPAAAQARAVRALCREQGVLFGLGGVYGNVLRMQPPLVLTAGEADQACDVLQQVLKQVARGR